MIRPSPSRPFRSLPEPARVSEQQRFRERRAVSLVLGMQCGDGVIIAADRRITGPTYTFAETKVILIHWNEGVAACACAGNHDTNKEFRRLIQEYFPHFPPGQTASADKVREMVHGALSGSVESGEEFDVLFGFQTADMNRAKLLWGLSKKDGTIRVVDGGLCEVIGADSPLTHYFRCQFNSAVLAPIPIGRGAVWAKRIICAATKYDGQYVGDGMDIVSVAHDKTEPGRSIQTWDDPPWTNPEQYMETFEYCSAALFDRLVGDKPPDISQIVTYMKDFRKHATGKDDFDLPKGRFAGEE